MALIKCPNCEARISDRALTCPKCGHHTDRVLSLNATKTRKMNHPYILIFLVLLIAVVLLIQFWRHSDTRNKTTSTSNGYSAYYSVPRTGTAGALATAESYLNSSAFSYTGLIDQLEYSGFSNHESTYAADNCGANWDAQALKNAKSYLRSSAFSYVGLIEQLEYSGFTSSQATYGADNCGADWYEQAVKQAKSYMNSSSNWTMSRLIDQLKYSGFTSSEATYGANNCGLW